MPVKTVQEHNEDEDYDFDADARINYNDAINYWSSVPASVNGVLGGYGEQTSVPKADIVGSLTFIRRLISRMPVVEGGKKLTIEMGAGIGRVTRDFLWKISDECDLLEPVVPFLNQMPNELKDVQARGKLGEVFPVGMQDWNVPENKQGKYWLIWCQWCVGQLPDEELVKFWIKCKENLMENGTIIVKENISSFEDIFDEDDSSVTRTDEKFRELFVKAGLKLIASDIQKGLPKELFPVRMYCLKPMN